MNETEKLKANIFLRMEEKIHQLEKQKEALLEAAKKIRKYHAFIPDALAVLQLEEAIDKAEGKP